MSALTPREVLLGTVLPKLSNFSSILCRHYPRERSASWGKIQNTLMDPPWVDQGLVDRCLAEADISRNLVREMADLERGAPLTDEQIAQLGGRREILIQYRNNLTRIADLISRDAGVPAPTSWSNCARLRDNIARVPDWQGGRGMGEAVAWDLSHYDDLAITDLARLERQS